MPIPGRVSVSVDGSLLFSYDALLMMQAMPMACSTTSRRPRVPVQS
jgi:hypothetical protein